MEKIESLQEFYKRKFDQVPGIFSSHQENLWAADVEFTAGELKSLTEQVSKIKIVGERYTGVQAEQTKK